MDDKTGGAPGSFNGGMNGGFHPGVNSPNNFGANPAPPTSPTPNTVPTLNTTPTPNAIPTPNTVPTPNMTSTSNTAPTPNATPMPGMPPVEPLAGNPATTLPGSNFGAANASPGTTGVPPRAVEPEGLNRPMMKAMPVAPVPKKGPNKKLIIGLSCGAGALLLLVAATLIVVTMLNKPDPVADAMAKLVTNGLPTNVGVNASISTQLTDQTQLISHYKITANASIMPANLTNSADLTVVMGGRDMEDTTFTMEEVYAGEKDLYFRFDSLRQAISDMDVALYHLNGGDEEDPEELFCEDEDGETIVCPDKELTVDDGTAEEATDEDATSNDPNDSAGDANASDTNASGEDVGDGTTDKATADENSSDKTTSQTDKTTNKTDKTTDQKDQKDQKVKVKSAFDETMMARMLDLADVIDGEWVQIGEGDVASPATSTTTKDPTAEESTPTATDDEATDATSTATDDEATNATPAETDSAASESTSTETAEASDSDFDITEYTAYLNQAIEHIGGRAALCSTDLIGTIRDNSSIVAEFYRNNPFIGGTDKGVTLTSTSYPVYQIVIEEEPYTAFVNAMKDQGFLDQYLKCAGESLTDVLNYPSTLPPIYTEIDSNHNFSRFYISTETGAASIRLDLNLSYPDTINVQQPQEYMTLSQLAQDLATLESNAEPATETEPAAEK